MASGSSPDLYNGFRENEPCTNDNQGGVLSLVTAVCLAAILFVIVGISASYPSYNEEAHRILWIVLLILIVLALISIITIFVMSKVRRSTWIISHEISRNNDLKCIFMWLCGIVVLVDVLLSFTANIQCMMKHFDTPAFYIYYATVHVLYFIYFIMQNAFIQVFKNTKFYGQKMFSCGILLIALANASLGFSAYVGSHGIYRYVNQTLSENSSEAAKESLCYISSEIGSLHNRLKPYFLPCRVEYSLLILYFVFSFWPSIAVESDNMQAIMLMSTNQGNPRYNSLSRDNQQASSWYRPINTVISAQCVSQLSEKSRKCIIAYGILSNVFLLVGTWMQVQYKSNVFDSHFSNYFFLFYKVYTLIILSLAFHIWTLRQNPQQKLGNMATSEYFLLFAGAGATAVCTFDAVVSSKIKDGVDIAFVLASAFTIIDIHYQIVLILNLRRTPISHMDKNVYMLLLLLAIGNFIHWVSDTFIVVAHFKRERYIEDVYGEELANFDHYSIFPLLVYFRLISGIELIDLYRRKRV